MTAATLLLLVSGRVATAAAQGPIALPAPQYPSHAPSSISRGDFNGDGVLDVVTTSTDGIATVAKGNAQGGFDPIDMYSFPGQLAFAVFGDVTGDGKIDLVAAVQATNPSQSKIDIRVGTPFGFSSFFFEISDPGNPNSIVLFDADGDGDLDLATANAASGNVSVAMNNGGVFGAFGQNPVGATPAIVAAADLDADGTIDLAATCSGSNTLAVLLQQGGGAFAPASQYSTGVGPEGLAIGDLDGDGRPDLVVAEKTAGTVSRRLNLGGGLFGPSLTAVAGASPSGIVVDDFDADGNADVATSLSADSFVRVIHGDGAGGLAPGEVSLVGLFPRWITSGDFDGDGFADVAVCCFQASAFTLLRGTGAAGLESPKLWPLATAASALVLVDLNGDGAPDAVVVSQSSPALLAANGDGAGGFGAPILASVPETVGADDVVVGDWNLDGKPDAVVSLRLAGRVYLLEGDGNGGFATPKPFDVPGTPYRLAADDLNGDGIRDVVVGNPLNLEIDVLLGSGHGGFQPLAAIAVNVRAGALTIGRIDADSNSDIAVLQESIVGSPFTVLLGDGSGVFTIVPPPLGAGIAGGSDLVLEDFNDDGVTDVAISEKESTLLLYGSGNANGLWASLVVLPSGTGGKALALCDLDGDGRNDLAVETSGPASVVRVVRATGPGTFAAPLEFASGISAIDLAAADLDGDGSVDLASANGGAASLTTLRNLRVGPSGTSSYGAGTPGCVGTIGVSANVAPHVGAATFALTSTNAPPRSVGLGIVGDAQDAAGSDLFGIGVDLHVDLIASSLLVGLNAVSDSSGCALAPAPIPSFPSLAGAALFYQSVWPWPASAACDPSPLGLASSKGLAFTILP